MQDMIWQSSHGWMLVWKPSDVLRCCVSLDYAILGDTFKVDLAFIQDTNNVQMPDQLECTRSVRT